MSDQTNAALVGIETNSFLFYFNLTSIEFTIMQKHTICTMHFIPSQYSPLNPQIRVQYFNRLCYDKYDKHHLI